jgi:DNA-binding CsgD family transcriptional regulator
MVAGPRCSAGAVRLWASVAELRLERGARERKILDLVAEGRPNAEIEESLWISRGTVRKHLDNIYAKLGVHTRTAAAAFVRERRLHSRER